MSELSKIDINNVNYDIKDLRSRESVSFLNATIVSILSYYECNTYGNVSAKKVDATGFVMPTNGGMIKVKFINRNSADSATLSIGDSVAKPLFYAGQPVSVVNTWEDGEVVTLYYDGTNWQANNIQFQTPATMTRLGAVKLRTRPYQGVPSNKSGLYITEDGELLINCPSDASLYIDGAGILRTAIKGSATVEEIEAGVSNEKAITPANLGAAMSPILNMIPAQASDSNKLADQRFVNSSIATATATYRGAYNVVSDLHLPVTASQAEIALTLPRTANNNDYCFVMTPVSSSDTSTIQKTDRYKHNGIAWSFEYTLNNSGFTAAQWAAINSAITSGLVVKLNDLPTMEQLTNLLSQYQRTLVSGTNIKTLNGQNLLGSGNIIAITEEATQAEIESKSNSTAITPHNFSPALNYHRVAWQDDIYNIKTNYARKDGAYEELLAGTAINLQGQDFQLNDAMYRTAGGDKDIASGVAQVIGIRGNTIKWNQLLAKGSLVDMGLPSGTLWASSNIDITQPSGFAVSPFQYECSFFSWGNIDGHNPTSTIAFDYDWGSANNSEPYYNGQPYGSTPGSELTASFAANGGYDAARENLGGIWRMPTSTEFNELLSNVIYIDADGNEVDTAKADKRVTVNGVLGLYLQSKLNGNRLFFPCSGFGSRQSWSNRDLNGYYWSSIFSSTRNARYLSITSSEVSSQYSGNRYLGFSIRPVFSFSNSPQIGKGGHKFLLSSNKQNYSDVTLIYGAGNEPTTVEQFEADYQKWFGKSLTYEPYDGGSLKPANIDKIRTVGFNLWTNDDYFVDTDRITKIDNNSLIITNQSFQERYNEYNLSKFIPILYNDTLEFSFDCETLSMNNDITGVNLNIGSQYNRIYLNSIGYKQHISTIISISDMTKILFGGWQYAGSIKITNICLHFVHSGTRDGDYEPYWSEDKAIHLTQITGKVNGGGENVVIFPDGMKKAGKVYDEIKVENGVVKAIKRVGSVDLGTLVWTYDSNKEVFKATINDYASTSNLLCPTYLSTNLIIDSDIPDKTIASGKYYASNRIMIKDSSYPSVSEFKTAMSGIILYYELATPIEYEVDNFSLPMNFKVDDFGTEEQVIDNYDGNQCSPALNIKYSINAVDTLRRLPQNYISKDSMSNFLNALGTVMGGTWSMMWNESSGKYTFSFTTN